MYLLNCYALTYVVQYNQQPTQYSSISSHTLMTILDT
jgi:hypothetical protein